MTFESGPFSLRIERLNASPIWLNSIANAKRVKSAFLGFRATHHDTDVSGGAVYNADKELVAVVDWDGSVTAPDGTDLVALQEDIEATAEEERAAAADHMMDEQRAYETGETVDIKMTWARTLPALIALIENGAPDGRKLAIEQLQLMAEVADKGADALLGGAA